MQTIELNVCNMEIFGVNHEAFWMGELTDLLTNFPVFEYSHKQDFYSLLIIEEGDGKIVGENQKYRIEAGKVIVIPPRCISKIEINRNAKGKLICFSEDFFSLRYNDNVLNQFSILENNDIKFIRLSDDQISKWNFLLGLFYLEYSSTSEYSNKILRSYLNIILFEMNRIYEPFESFKSNNLKKEKINLFEKYVEQYFYSKKYPHEYANLLNVTPNYLNKLCKEETGKTSSELIRKRIIIEAKRMLSYTNNSISEIAEKIGFESTSYFISYFKKTTNFSPDQFRKNILI
jgi:AraC-like DNA-binding protein/mannose-6-phosphate isomerase-like protein (cupin superfamily)